MAPLRWGIAGAGKISNDFVASLATLSVDQHQITAVAARNEQSAKEFAETFGINKYYGGYEKLAADVNVDVVYIGAINPVHYDLGIMMLNGGKHVLCEKPLCMNEKQANKLMAHAKLKNLFCMEAIWSRFFPSYIHLKNRIDKHELGDIKEIDIEFGFDLTDADRCTKKSLGGGTVLDLGVYPIQLCQWVFRDEPISITATGKLNDDGVDEEMSAILKYANGGIARIKTSGLKELHNKANIQGTKASMTLHDFWCCTQLTDINSESKEWPLAKFKKGTFFFNNSQGLAFEAEQVRQCINANLIQSPSVTHDESLIIARIEDEIRRQIGVKYPQDD